MNGIEGEELLKYAYGAFAGNRWIQTPVLILFWFGLAFVGILFERLFRLKETFIILDFSTYSVLLKTWITFLSLLAVQLLIYIWNKGIAKGIRRVVWGGKELFAEEKD